MKIFIFWIGDKTKISNHITTFKKYGHDVIVGPSEKDDKYLTNKYKYYKMAIAEKKYSFASDVWRFWKLSNNEGLYIDVSTEIGTNFNIFLNNVSKNKVWIPRSSDIRPECCIMYSDGKNNYFKKILKYFEFFELPTTLGWWIGPSLVMAYAVHNNHIQENNWNEYEIDNITYGTYLSIRNSKEVVKRGSGSWNASGDSSEPWWSRMEKNWNEKVNDTFAKKALIRYFNNNDFPKVYPVGLRQFYDASISKKDLKKLKQAYKKADKVFFTDRLIWSKLFRFFTFKKSK